MWSAHREAALALAGAGQGMDKALRAFGEGEWPQKQRDAFAARIRRKLRLALTPASAVLAKVEAKVEAKKPERKKKAPKATPTADAAVLDEAFAILEKHDGDVMDAAESSAKDGGLTTNHLKHLCLHKAVYTADKSGPPSKIRMLNVLVKYTKGGKLERGEEAPAPAAGDDESDDDSEKDDDDDDAEEVEEDDDEDGEEEEEENESDLPVSVLVTKRFIETSAHSLALNALHLRAMLREGGPEDKDWKDIGVEPPDLSKGGRKGRRGKRGRGKTPESGAKRPKSAYNLFVQSVFASNKGADGEKVAAKEVMSEASKKWKSMTPAEKKKYEDDAASLKAEGAPVD